MKVSDIISDSMSELLVLSSDGSASAEDLALGLVRFNRMMDMWAAMGIMAFRVAFSDFTLQANHAPHTIGPAGDFAVAQRPVKITSAQFNLAASGTAIFKDIRIRDKDWWAAQTIPALTSSVVTDLYYDPDWPLGKCNFWPVPTVANQVQLELWGLLLGSASASGDTFTLPPGYWNAAVTNLALLMAPAFGAAAIVSPELRENARKALQVVQANNSESPRLATMDAGMPASGRSVRPGFNFLTGEPW